MSKYWSKRNHRLKVKAHMPFSLHTLFELFLPIFQALVNNSFSTRWTRTIFTIKISLTVVYCFKTKLNANKTDKLIDSFLFLWSDFYFLIFYLSIAKIQVNHYIFGSLNKHNCSFFLDNASSSWLFLSMFNFFN